MKLRTIFALFRWWILLAVGLVVIENIAWILEPSVFGPVIDALIADADVPGWKNALGPLMIWVGVFAVNSGVGAFRRAYDQNIYLSIYTRIATRVAEISRERGLSSSRMAARTQLARELITFLQYRMPEVLEQLIAIGGSLIGLWFFDYRIALACAVVTVPLSIVTVIYARKVVPLQAAVHDRMEEMYDVFERQDVVAIESYYRRIAIPQKQIARWGAFTFGLMRFFLLGIFLTVLYIAIDLDSFTTGNIYSIVAYVWTFVTSSEYLPELMESWTSLHDITGRLRQEGKGEDQGVRADPAEEQT
jgi:ABC-type multidrug transport system fused ATPase/permease subunit